MPTRVTSITVDDLAILAACVARVQNENYIDLVQRLVDDMLPREKAHFRDLYSYLSFSPRRRGKACPL